MGAVPRQKAGGLRRDSKPLITSGYGRDRKLVCPASRNAVEK